MKFFEARKTSETTPESGASSYLQDQINFLSVQITKLQDDLSEKEVTIQKILHEKRETCKMYDSLEARNNALEETLTLEKGEKQEAHMALQNMQLILAAQRMKRATLSPKRGRPSIVHKSQNRLLLEEDGIECFDLEML